MFFNDGKLIILLDTDDNLYPLTLIKQITAINIVTLANILYEY